MNSLPLGFVKKAVASPRCENVKASLLFLRQGLEDCGWRCGTWEVYFRYVWPFPSFYLM